MIADQFNYLASLCDELAKKWPDNRTVNLVFHGHSVPSGYACTPYVDTFSAYPYLVHRTLKQRFPYAVINVIVTAVGGENAEEGSRRFCSDVLCHKPDLVILDYGLNDRAIGLDAAEAAWRFMIRETLTYGAKMMLMTPSWDMTWFGKDDGWKDLEGHAALIRSLAEEYSLALGDSFAAFGRYVKGGGSLVNLLSHVNHPSPLGHELIAEEITAYFPAR